MDTSEQVSQWSIGNQGTNGNQQGNCTWRGRDLDIQMTEGLVSMVRNYTEAYGIISLF